MLIDVIALILLVLALFKGMSKGLIVAVFSFLGFIIGLAAALKLSAAAAEYIGTNVEVSQRWLPVISFIVVFIIVIFLIRIGAKFIEGAVRIAMLGWLNRIGGFLFYALIYFFIFSILLFYAVQLNLIKPATTEASVTYSIIQPIAPSLIKVLGKIIPFFGNVFSELLQFFDGISESRSNTRTTS